MGVHDVRVHRTGTSRSTIPSSATLTSSSRPWISRPNQACNSSRSLPHLAPRARTDSSSSRPGRRRLSPKSDVAHVAEDLHHQ